MTAPALKKIPLARDSAESIDVAALAPLATKLAHGLERLLQAREGSDLAVTAGSPNSARYSEWRIVQNPFGVFLRFLFPDGNEEMLVQLPGHLICQIVDMQYGGDGIVPVQARFGAAELAFVNRLGDQIACLFESAVAQKTAFGGTETDLLTIGWPKTREAVAIQPFTVESGAIRPIVINLVLSAITMKTLSGSKVPGEADGVPADSRWANRMRAATMEVPVPARCALAQSEISFQRLMALSPGDILPMIIPAQIPLTIAGRNFAHGALGEANGRAALRIEKIERTRTYE